VRIEYPKGSGRFADLSPEELAYLNGFTAQAERGEITGEEATRQIGHLLDLKIEFGVELVEEDEADVAPF